MVTIRQIFAGAAIAFLFVGSTRAGEGDSASVERGAYIADIGDCASCHTAPGRENFAGGLALQAPFGTIFSTNITPDQKFGIGGYSRPQFIRAMREGVAADGSHLYPAMPYASFSAVSDDDLNDLYDYLMKGVKPVAYQPPETKLVFPFNQRWGLLFWDAVFARHDRFAPDPSRDEQWNRGAYLVQGLGHCGACHTPRGLAYQEIGYDQKSSSYLHGAVADKWATANLTGDLGSGLGRWSEADVAAFLKTGHGGSAAAFGNMKEAVEKSTQHLTADDAAAIAHYLKSFPAKDGAIAFQPSAADVVNRDRADLSGERELPGAGLFASACAGCHGKTGEGQLPRFPEIAGNPAVLTRNPISVMRIVLEGSTSPETATGPKAEKMPAFAHLTDREIAEVVTYVRKSWGNSAPPASERDVSSLRTQLSDRRKVQEEATEKANWQP
jgi:mono/diheme cytochrome c family protein